MVKPTLEYFADYFGYKLKSKGERKMKINAKLVQDFSPVEITLTMETKKELDAFLDLLDSARVSNEDVIREIGEQIYKEVAWHANNL